MTRHRRNCNETLIHLLLILITFIFLIPAYSQDMVKVGRVIDGDTLLLTTGEKVRLIGIDAPESRVNPGAGKQVEWEGKDLKTIISMGEQATRFVSSLLKPEDQVRIEFDVEKRDPYGRFLGCLYLADGRMLNQRDIKGWVNMGDGHTLT